ncbi:MULTISPECIES: glucosaminidase domain-containing protein [Bacillus cereus group]|nr:glucosaminidase domain-containing protein [Bacillus cereus]HDR4351019.1 glucosaminidase domain-containing protein [Bacillus cereus]
MIGGTAEATSSYSDPVTTANYQTIDIRYPSRVTAEEINNYIRAYESYTGKTSVFHDQGQLFIQIGTETGINQLILAAMAIHESAYGTNSLSKGKYNLFSVGAYDSSPYDSAYKFNTVEQAVRYQAYFLKTNYLNPDSWKFKGYYLGDALSGMNYYYASDNQWGEAIAQHAEKIHPFDSDEYTNVAKMNGTVLPISIPEYTEEFSSNTKAIANHTLSIKNSIGGSEIISIPQGSEFNVLTKYNNQWFRVSCNGTVGYLKVDLSTYNNYFTIKNLVRTTDLKYYTQLLEDDHVVIKDGQTKVFTNEKVQWISTKDLENVYR